MIFSFGKCSDIVWQDADQFHTKGCSLHLERNSSSRRIQLVKHQFHHFQLVLSWLSVSSALNFSSLSADSLSINSFAKVHCSKTLFIGFFLFLWLTFFSSAVALLLRSRSFSASVSWLFLSNDELHNIRRVCKFFTVY